MASFSKCEEGVDALMEYEDWGAWVTRSSFQNLDSSCTVCLYLIAGSLTLMLGAGRFAFTSRIPRSSLEACLEAFPNAKKYGAGGRPLTTAEFYAALGECGSFQVSCSTLTGNDECQFGSGPPGSPTYTYLMGGWRTTALCDARLALFPSFADAHPEITLS